MKRARIQSNRRYRFDWQFSRRRATEYGAACVPIPHSGPTATGRKWRSGSEGRTTRPFRTVASSMRRRGWTRSIRIVGASRRLADEKPLEPVSSPARIEANSPERATEYGAVAQAGWTQRCSEATTRLPLCDQSILGHTPVSRGRTVASSMRQHGRTCSDGCSGAARRASHPARTVARPRTRAPKTGSRYQARPASSTKQEPTWQIRF